MKTRVSHNSLLANAKTDKPTKRALIYRYIVENKLSTYDQIATALQIQAATVTARLNQLHYDYQLIKVAFDSTENKAVYTVRNEGDPKNERPLSNSEKIKIKICTFFCIDENQFDNIINDKPVNLHALPTLIRHIDDDTVQLSIHGSVMLPVNENNSGTLTFKKTL